MLLAEPLYPHTAIYEYWVISSLTLKHSVLVAVFWNVLVKAMQYITKYLLNIACL